MYFHIRQLSTPRFEEKPSEFSLEGSKNPWISNQLETLPHPELAFEPYTYENNPTSSQLDPISHILDGKHGFFVFRIPKLLFV